MNYNKLYFDNVVGPVDKLSDNVGYPDGDGRPSVTLSWKQVYVMKATAAGNISFLIAPFARGCIVMLDGYQSKPYSLITSYNPATGLGWDTSTGTNVQGQLPIVGTSQMSTSSSGVYTAFRPLVAVADCCFTGSTLYDAGTVTVAQVGNTLQPRGSFTVDASTDYSLDKLDGTSAGNAESAASLPNSATFAARQPFTVRVSPACPTYAPMTAHWITDADDHPIGMANNTLSYNQGLPCQRYAACCPWKAVSYSGLVADTSVTVSVRYTAQFIVDDSNTELVPLAGPSPPPTMETESLFQRIVNSIPTVEPSRALQGLSRLLNAYMTGSGNGGHRPHQILMDEL